jgi:hypothetical protein
MDQSRVRFPSGMRFSEGAQFVSIGQSDVICLPVNQNFRNQVRALQKQYQCFVRVVPIKNWKGK